MFVWLEKGGAQRWLDEMVEAWRMVEGSCKRPMFLENRCRTQRWLVDGRGEIQLMDKLIGGRSKDLEVGQ